MTLGFCFRAARPIVAAVLLGLATACVAAPTPTGTTAGGNALAVRAFEGHAEDLELTIDGIVDRVLADQPGPSGPHERFIVRLADVDLTVLIEHNLSIAPRVPVSAGDRVLVHGEYIWNTQGGLLHFTHHDPQGSHEGGYIVYAGKRYD